MVTPRQYVTAGALRAARETRLLEPSRRDDVDLQRLRRQVAFDRQLDRMFDPAHAARDGWGSEGRLRARTAVSNDPDPCAVVIHDQVGAAPTVGTENALRAGN